MFLCFILFYVSLYVYNYYLLACEYCKEKKKQKSREKELFEFAIAKIRGSPMYLKFFFGCVCEA